jgi:AAA family ATP:ADP antiporter
VTSKPPESTEQRLKRIRVVGLCALAFLNMLVYAMVRPGTESLFITRHTKAGLPWVWLLVPLGVVGVVTIYNRFVARSDLLRLFSVIAALSGLTLALLLSARAAGLPAVHYVLYTWKDIYMVVLVEVFYSFANSVFPIRTARWVYGLFGLLSSLGGMAGSALLGLVAHHFGTVAAMWAAAPLLLLLTGISWPFARLARSGELRDRAREEGHSILAAIRVVRGSSYLLWLLALVAVIQVMTTLVDYEYFSVMAAAYPQEDQLTVVSSAVYFASNLATIGLNSVCGPILRLAGVPLTLLAVPFLLAAGLLVYRAAPSVLTVSVVKVASKCFDYTIFRAAKEILYIPLSHEEKTNGKSIVDIVTYRVAKGGAAALVLLLQALSMVVLVTPVALALTLAWLIITVVIVKRFRRLVSREQELLARTDPG